MGSDEEKPKGVNEEVVNYPGYKSAGFLFGENLFERFAYYGIRAVLVLYLKDMLGYSDDMSTIIYHLFTTL